MKTKKITLAEAWEKCIGQWDHVAQKLTNRSRKAVEILKKDWVASVGSGDSPESDCYFCEYATQHGGGFNSADKAACSECPGVKVDPNFDCHEREYNYYTEPIKFRKKLQELHRLRRQKKKIKRG
jgi:hypothetical protein